MYATQKIPRCLSFALFWMLTAVVIGQSLRESRGSLAGATKQYEERWQAVQGRFKNDAGFMNLVKREKERRDHFLSYSPIDPNNAYDLENQAILMRDNSKWLNGMLVNPATPSDSEGVYWDGMGNSLRIRKVEGKYYFVINKYESSHGHQGSIAGAFGEWEIGRATFKGDFGPEVDPNAEYFPRKPKPKIGSVKFELRNGLLVVTTSGSIRSIGGPRASFAAVYSRVSVLKERDDRILSEGLQHYGPLKFQSPFK